MFLKLVLLSALIAAGCTSHRDETSEEMKSEPQQVKMDSFVNRVFSAGDNVFPDLRNYCSGRKSPEEGEDIPYVGFLPYNAAIGKLGFWGYAEGHIRGCGTSKLTFEGYFNDISMPSTNGKSFYCNGSLNLAQSDDQLIAIWKMGKNSLPEVAKCDQEFGKTFSLTLKPTTLEKLTTKYLTFYEYNVSLRPYMPEMPSKFAMRVIANGGVPGIDPGFNGNEVPINFKSGSLLQAYHCDRGGADFPETGVCYKLNEKGEAWGVVLEKSEPTPHMYTTKKARLKRGEVKIISL